MHILQPSKTYGRTSRGARVLVEPAADVFAPPIRISAENNVGGRLHDRIKLLIFLRQVVINLFQSQRLLFQLTRSLLNPLLQFAIQALELELLAMQLGEYSHLRPQDFGNDRNRKVIYGAMLIPFQAIDIR